MSDVDVLRDVWFKSPDGNYVSTQAFLQESTITKEEYDNRQQNGNDVPTPAFGTPSVGAKANSANAGFKKPPIPSWKQALLKKGKKDIDVKVVVVKCVINGEVIPTMKENILPRNPVDYDFTRDIIDLKHLNEATVAHTIQQRYKAAVRPIESPNKKRVVGGSPSLGSIHSYSGPVLIVINPLKPLPVSIYGPDHIQSYHTSKNIDTMEPHIYAVAERALRGLLLYRESQTILVTGQSGAGKTESTSRIVEYFADVTPSDASLVYSLSKQLVEVAPILESFGNAVTVRNNNSSRFSKLIQVFYQDGVMVGAQVQTYLFETSRVTHFTSQERSFHVFHQLMSAPEAASTRECWGLEGSAKDYVLTTRGKVEVEGVDDCEGFVALQHALKTIGFTPEHISMLFGSVAAILHMSNIKFSDGEAAGGCTTAAFAGDPVTVHAVKWAAHCLGVTEGGFRCTILKKSIRDTYAHRSVGEARKELASISKILYYETFQEMVGQMNSMLDKMNSMISSSNGGDISFKVHVFDIWANPIHSNSLAHGKSKGITVFEHGTTRQAKAIQIDHYAGPVIYELDGWVRMNKESATRDTKELLSQSSVAQYRILAQAMERGDVAFSTQSQRHVSQLRELLDHLSATKLQYIRCLLPNAERIAGGHVDVPMLLQQLSCNGIVEGVKILQSGFPSRYTQEGFMKHYEILLSSAGGGIKRLLSMVQPEASRYHIGPSTIFLKGDTLGFLEEKLLVEKAELEMRLQREKDVEAKRAEERERAQLLERSRADQMVTARTIELESQFASRAEQLVEARTIELEGQFASRAEQLVAARTIELEGQFALPEKTHQELVSRVAADRDSAADRVSAIEVKLKEYDIALRASEVTNIALRASELNLKVALSAVEVKLTDSNMALRASEVELTESTIALRASEAKLKSSDITLRASEVELTESTIALRASEVKLKDSNMIQEQFRLQTNEMIRRQHHARFIHSSYVLMRKSRKVGKGCEVMGALREWGEKRSVVV